MTIKNPKDKNFTNKFHLQSMTTHMNHKRKKGKKRHTSKTQNDEQDPSLCESPRKNFCSWVVKTQEETLKVETDRLRQVLNAHSRCYLFRCQHDKDLGHIRDGALLSNRHMMMRASSIGQKLSLLFYYEIHWFRDLTLFFFFQNTISLLI